MSAIRTSPSTALQSSIRIALFTANSNFGAYNLIAREEFLLSDQPCVLLRQLIEWLLGALEVADALGQANIAPMRVARNVKVLKRELRLLSGVKL